MLSSGKLALSCILAVFCTVAFAEEDVKKPSAVVVLTTKTFEHETQVHSHSLQQRLTTQPIIRRQALNKTFYFSGNFRRNNRGLVCEILCALVRMKDWLTSSYRECKTLELTRLLRLVVARCGHCKALAPHWEELAHDLKEEGTVNVAKVYVSQCIRLRGGRACGCEVLTA